MNFARPQRNTFNTLDRDGWRLCLRKVYVDGTVVLSAHHFETFERRVFRVAVDGSWS